jgi:hypothetical protein
LKGGKVSLRSCWIVECVVVQQRLCFLLARCEEDLIIAIIVAQLEGR